MAYTPLPSKALEKARRVCWTEGDLSYLLLPHQIELDTIFQHNKDRTFVVNCSRRWGKSFYMVVRALAHCINRPNAQVLYAAPYKNQVGGIINPHIREILKDCPEDLRPFYSSAAHTWTFPNDSVLKLVGCDGGSHENLRGAYTTLGIVDEAGFIDDLQYVVKSIILPQTITCDGRIFIISTPPKSPAHPFKEFYDKAVMKGSAVKRDIYSASHITPALIEEYIHEVGGQSTTDWRREFLCEFVTDESSAVIPEWFAKHDLIVKEVPRPTHYDPYVSIDFGFNDLTFAVFGYWDYTDKLLVIEDEVVCRKKASGDIIQNVRAVERNLWPDRNAYLRMADADPMLLADIAIQHGYMLGKTRNDDPEAMINELRLFVQHGRLRINPRCKNLVEHLAFAVWNNSKSKLERTEEYGHFDGVMALCYMIRNLDRTKDPFPAYLKGEQPATHHMPAHGRHKGNAKTVQNIFRRPRR